MTLAMVKRYDIDTPNSSTIWEAVSTMGKSFEISGAAGEPVKLAMDCIGYNLLRTGTENTAAELLALPDNAPSRVHFGDLTFRIGDIADALANGDRVTIKSFSLKFDSKLSDLLGRKGRICLLRFALAAAEHYTDLHVSVRSVAEIPSYRQICAERKKIRNIW